MSIDEERKNQESEPIAARANTRPRRRGPMGRGGMMPGVRVRHRLDRVQHCGPEGSLDSYHRTL